MSGWHIQQNGVQKGPFNDEQLRALCETGVINAGTLVWKSEYSEWKALAETDFIYRSSLLPPPINRAFSTPSPSNQGDPAHGLSLWDYFARALGQRYAIFEGRAERKEFWGFALFSVLFFLLAALGGLLIDAGYGNLNLQPPQFLFTAILSALFLIIILLPSLALNVRRLHDIGLTGWLVLLQLLPYIGLVFWLVMGLVPGEQKANKHGLSAT